MQTELTFDHRRYRADLAKPLDISLPLDPEVAGPNAFHAPVFRADPVRVGDFVGDTRYGGAVNFKNVALNPHGNGTHTECVGHIAVEPFRIHDCLRNFHFPARLVSLYPVLREDGDRIITESLIREVLEQPVPPALVIRTLPNDDSKGTRHWTGTNPPYMEAGAATALREAGVAHLILDLPSVDREEDGGLLAAHKAFWHYPVAPRAGATITEMAYIPDPVSDGLYLLNLQIVSFVLDVSPSKPVLYALEPLP